MALGSDMPSGPPDMSEHAAVTMSASDDRNALNIPFRMRVTLPEKTLKERVQKANNKQEKKLKLKWYLDQRHDATLKQAPFTPKDKNKEIL